MDPREADQQRNGAGAAAETTTDEALFASQLTERLFRRVFRADGQQPPWRTDHSTAPDLVRPGDGYVGMREVFTTVLGLGDGQSIELGNVPQGRLGHRLLAVRYFIENADIWLRHFRWNATGEPADVAAMNERIQELAARIGKLRKELSGRVPVEFGWVEGLLSTEDALAGDPTEGRALEALVLLSMDPQARDSLRTRLRERARQLITEAPAQLDRLYLASLELDRYPATTVSAGELKYVLVVDKGEMGTRAVREAAALGKVPVVFHSVTDDPRALQVRLAEDLGGFAIGLAGSFRESYANFVQITTRAHQVFQERFGENWKRELARAALYPGYGPLAENAAAIAHFRRHGIVFVGPQQDVVERAGDKRQFRAVVEAIAPEAVTPGIVIGESDAAAIKALILEGHAQGRFGFPGRLKAANGGGGRGQAIVPSPEGLDAAIAKVLGEIQTFRWDPGVMFEQNIPETIHLEVQVLRDRYGNTRHFGMRDCTEQRASQKIQEEAPPALLRAAPELQRWIEEAAVRIADSVGYVGAGTIELMYKDGKVFFLEMNTRIQVEHPVTEESHGIRRAGGTIDPLNLVRWQMRLANGEPIDFNQADVVQTHVAREFRINAESWHPQLKDARDGKRGLFVPNAGIFDRFELPKRAEIMRVLRGTAGLEDVKIRFDTGFEVEDVLVNKDPTFGKLIVAVRAARPEDAYELLRQVSLAVLARVRIEGRQVRPDGKVIEGSTFRTNVPEHQWVLAQEILVRHGRGDERGRHVNWVVDALRAQAAP